MGACEKRDAMDEFFWCTFIAQCTIFILEALPVLVIIQISDAHLRAATLFAFMKVEREANLVVIAKDLSALVSVSCSNFTPQ